ncbi:hypothetical protein BG015_002036 [Linnemannia schmuckeri]|uniref:alpha-1,2-Mannosidase n=1 Tax=Linnemannia schmuckeri TaxID=64567 RepID=A0A9P5S3A0_9FUNG|nr:hypothetical protein BG015_002036 [Linnemannia schmuckeri]
MGADEEAPGHGSRARPSTATTTLLPTHRFLTTVARHTSPFYSVPLHYLKRRGVLLVLLCMGGIAFLHAAYLFPSDGDVLHGSSSRSRSHKKNPFLTLGHIQEPPSYGSAPVNGVDEDGFEIVEEPFVDRKEGGAGYRQHSGQESSSQQQQQREVRKPPRIQFDFEASPAHNAEARTNNKEDRYVAVKSMIRHAWFGFVSTMLMKSGDIKTKSQQLQVRGEWIDIMDTLLLAWMSDEYGFAKIKVQELTGPRRLSKTAPFEFRPWLKNDQGQQEVEKQQEQDLDEVQEDVDNESTDSEDRGIWFFDTVVRQLGGLLSIYELERSRSIDDPEILKAAVELGDQLTLAFQGPNNALPANTIFESGSVGLNRVLAGKVSLAEVSTFQLEFRQLSHLTSNGKYKNLAESNFKYLASLNPKIPGLYPAYFDPKDGAAPEYVASFGSLSDGFYEYLLKTYLLTGEEKFKDAYISSIEAMHKHLISHSQKSSEPHLILGVYDTATDSLIPKMDHLSCFAPGLLALGAKVLNRPNDLTVARGLMETCFISYQKSATGLGADEIAFLRPEFSKGKEFEMLPRGTGFYLIDPEYALQTVESLFLLYRITGEEKYQEYAWEIAQAIEKHCRTKDGYSGLVNVMDASEGLTNTMPSHFLSQTLKYLYLIFDNPEVTSLDDYIFNTEGHLIKYPIL